MGLSVTHVVKNLSTSPQQVLASNTLRRALYFFNKDATNSVTIKFEAASNTIDVTQVQTIAFGAAPASGTFVMGFNGNNSAAINWNDSASAIQTKLQAVTGLGSVTVSGSIASKSLVVTMTSVVVGVDPQLPLFTISSNSLGTTVVPTVTTQGAFADGLKIPAGGTLNLSGDTCPDGNIYGYASANNTRLEILQG